MSNPSLFVSPLVRQAARNLRTVECLYENGTWRPDWLCRRYFWRTRRTMALTPDEAAAWLPALAFAVSCEKDESVLAEFARWPLPEPLPPEALPWRDRLIQVWEQYPADTNWEKTVRLGALVRLDRRVERLPEWLKEARRAPGLRRYDRHLRLAALAVWRPRPGDGPPHGDKTGAAEAWVRFWEKSYKSPDMDSLIAAAALLHLTEAGWLPSGLSPEQLREEFRQRVRQYPFSYDDRSVLRMLLSSIPADVSTPERWRRDVTEWLKLTGKDVEWDKREAVWDMLAAWQREGVLERGGIGRGRLPEPPLLLPDLARKLKCEQDGEVLRAMAGYVPVLAEVRAHPEAMRAIIARWEALSRDDYLGIPHAAWVARWNLRRAGALTAEEQARFDADYGEAVKFEPEVIALLTLARITPPGTFPLATWAGRLSDWNDGRRLAAHLAIHGWLVDMEGGGQRRQVRQALRRGEQGVTDAGTVAPFVNLPPEVWPDFRRLHEIETALAAGHLSPSPDAAAENRVTPCAVLARLPEAHPRTGPPGITDRTAGSEPPARHPFPEVIRHE
jgi:hypothetical protein